MQSSENNLQENKICAIKVFIDADSCPKSVRDFVIHYCNNSSPKIQIFLAANKEIECTEKEYTMVVLEKEKDSADNWILNQTDEKSLVVTRDILFAQKLVSKGIKAINDRGTSFTKDNIEKLVEDRNFDLQLAEIGLGGSKKKIYGQKQLEDFIQCFKKEMDWLKKRYQSIIV